MKPSTFQIYNASAGSGKTFALVKEYLKLLLSSDQIEPYKNILAITFTNKAVAEMKERIIHSLRLFSDKKNLSTEDAMFNAVIKDLKMTPEKAHKRSKEILENLIHNYAAFDVSTIDKFTQKLIRTFAYDLKLAVNFNVELDTEAIFTEAIDNLIAKAGADKKLTKVLLDFAIEKADDDKSFNIEYDFRQIAKLLENEADIQFLETLRHKTLDDFNDLNLLLKGHLSSTKKQIVSISNKALQLIAESGLEFTDFSRGTLPNHFFKASELKLEQLYKNKLQENLAERKSIYTKTLDSSLAEIIDAILPELEADYLNLKSIVYHNYFLQNFYKNLTPLSVLNEINKEVHIIKEDRNLLLISEFNSIVSRHLSSQPAPFIYERIGEKFKHYFIDEFQDTSIMQWGNLTPLIANALSGENASTMLVGDAKQAIYRWRGGKAEQFMNLFNEKENPFQVSPTINNLESNFRSHKVIVDFNNSFFKHLSEFAFSNTTYAQLFAKATQQFENNKEGFVNLTFLDLELNDDKESVYSHQTLETIKQCLNEGFEPKDICVLIRRKKEGVAIANYVIENSNLKVVSSETLLISNSPDVAFIIDLIKLTLEPEDKENKIKVLHYLAANKLEVTDYHSFFEKTINLNLKELFKILNSNNYNFNYNIIQHIPIYEAIELIIHSFNLVEKSNAYLQFFLDFALDYGNKQAGGLLQFVEHYEKKKDSLSIIGSDEQDAVQIMTIHKSKGLEFPIVIFPFADIDIYREINGQVWFPLESEDYLGFDYALLNFNQQLQEFGSIGEHLYLAHKAELELDNINLLYVALTRSIEQLYIISNKRINNKGEENLNYYSGLLINYLKHLNLWQEETSNYEFGSMTKSTKKSLPDKNIYTPQSFISTPLLTHNINFVTKSGFLWNTLQQKAIERGNLIHLIMSFIKTKNDVEFTFDTLSKNGQIGLDQLQILKPLVEEIVNHPDLIDYFSSEIEVFTERELITDNGLIVIPDRLIFTKSHEVIIIDYKTGEQRNSHNEQLIGYKNALEKMELSVSKCILIYINDSIKIKEV